MKTALVIGGGITGCCAAHLIKQKNFQVTLVEKQEILGGGVRTFTYGGHPFTYGPRHFITKKEKLFNFLNDLIPLRRIQEHEFLTYVERDGAFYHYPINTADIKRMPDHEQIQKELKQCSGVENAKNMEEYWIRSVGPTLYSKFIDDYSKKMWQVKSNTEIDDFNWSPKGVAIKDGPKAAWTEAISAFPKTLNGYNDLFDKTTQGVSVLLNTTISDYDISKRRVKIHDEWKTFDIIVSTISPEVIFKNAYGSLRWIGRDFQLIVLPMEHCFPKNVYFLYYANQEPFTRIVEYKKFYRHKSPTTLLGLEIPSFNGQLYPFPMLADQEKANRYLRNLPKDVFSIGRHGCYQYRYDIAPSLEQCLDLASKL